MKGSNRLAAGLAFVLVAVCFGWRGAAGTAAAQNCCTIPQSPRVLTSEHWNYTSNVPLVRRLSDTSISYTPRAGVTPMVLNRCSQHYHCFIENVQACPKETNGGSISTCPPPKVGDLIEIHTVYHAGHLVPLPSESTSTCTDPPLVVVGYHATLVPGNVPAGIPVHFGNDLAEWSGSTTNEDQVPAECKAAAFWHFTLGCDFTIPLGALQAAFTHPDPARALQPADRLSNDLTHVVVRR
jgi:hypothetical protein